MNKVILVGRITKDPELKRTNSDVPYLQFTVAVQRAYQKGGEKQTDFINCVAWRQTAENIAKYFKKGQRILVEGNIQVRTYDDKSGVKHYITEVVVDSFEFIEQKSDTQQQNNNYGNQSQSYDRPQNQMPNQNQNNNPFVNGSNGFDIVSDDLPF